MLELMLVREDVGEFVVVEVALRDSITNLSQQAFNPCHSSIVSETKCVLPLFLALDLYIGKCDLHFCTK